MIAPVLHRPDDLDERRAYVRKMKEARETWYQEAVDTLNQSIEYPNARNYIKMLEGDWWDRRRPKYLSPFYDNKLQYARYSKLALLTDIRPTIDVYSRVKEWQEQANICKNIIQHEWYRNDLDMSLVTVADSAMLFGNGFWKIGASMPGYMKFTPCGPDMVMPIQPGMHLQDSTAIMYRAYKPLQYFQKIWPLRCDGLEQEAVDMDIHTGEALLKPFHVDDITWQAMSPQMKRQVGIQSQTANPYKRADKYPVIELQEFWLDDQNINDSKYTVRIKDPYLSESEHNYWYDVQPMGSLYPRKRLIVFAGSRLMYDGPSPYWHGQFPFAMLRMNPVSWSFWGLSQYRSLVQLNRLINEIAAGTADMVKRALNPQMITKEGGVPRAAWDVFFANMPGGKLRLGPTADPSRDVRFMDPPQLPGYVFQMLTGYLIPEFDRMSGFLDPNKVAGKKQVPGGETIEQMRDSMNTMTRLEGRYLELFLRDTGYLAISNIFQFYTAVQRMKILGADGLTWADFDYDPQNMIPSGFRDPDGKIKEIFPKEDFHKNFTMEIAQGTLDGRSKDRDRQVSIAMAKMQLISKAELFRRLDMANGDQVLKELAQEHQEGLGGSSGRTPRQTRGQRQGEAV